MIHRAGDQHSGFGLRPADRPRRRSGKKVLFAAKTIYLLMKKYIDNSFQAIDN